MLNDPNKPLVNPFLAAKRVPMVMVSLRVEDVMAALPQLSKFQAEQVLMGNAALVAHVMLIAGTDAIVKLVLGGDHGQ